MTSTFCLSKEFNIQLEGSFGEGENYISINRISKEKFSDVFKAASVRVEIVDSISSKVLESQFVTVGMDYWLLVKLPVRGKINAIMKLSRLDKIVPVSTSYKIATSDYRVSYDCKKNGGLPESIHFNAPESTWNLQWRDRVYSSSGLYSIANDKKPEIRVLSDGPICTVVQTSTRFLNSQGKAPESHPYVKYTFVYFKNTPFVNVCVEIFQDSSVKWNELHFGELGLSDTAEKQWTIGQPSQHGSFTGAKVDYTGDHWGGVVKNNEGIAFVGDGPTGIYDDKDGDGVYVHAFSKFSHKGWDSSDKTLSTWLWIGTANDALKQIELAAMNLPDVHPIILSLTQSNDWIESWEHKAIIKGLEQAYRFDILKNISPAFMKKHYVSLQAGKLGMVVEKTHDGFALLTLYDIENDRLLIDADASHLFEITFSGNGYKNNLLTSSSGWTKSDIEEKPDQITLTLIKSGPGNQKQISVRVVIAAIPSQNRFELSITADSNNQNIGISEVVFSDLSFSVQKSSDEIFLPFGSGLVKGDLNKRSYECEGIYPNGETEGVYPDGLFSMQYTSFFYGSSCKTRGLYYAIEDPLAMTKNMSYSSRAMSGNVNIRFKIPSENMGLSNNHFELSGKLALQLFDGDWYDAAILYRDWVEKESRWGKTSDKNRKSTPAWLGDVDFWVVANFTTPETIRGIKNFAEKLGLTVGLHWYDWHCIPFDNDYPHYFPARNGFMEGVNELQKAGVRVVPYINGRLWDTRDKGMEDWQFTKLAKPYAVKRQDGSVETEIYGSKESDGSDVRHAVMCPATEFWQDKVKEIVLALFNEYGVDGVYVDQVAAQKPLLCFDTGHGHPVGGGSWWATGYQEMFDRICREMPAGKILASECTAEPYIRQFDAYLSWHWQYDGQVPAYPIIYGDKIKLFGRFFDWFDRKPQSVRMKIAQQLVFGDQLGWISYEVIKEKENYEFICNAAWLRHRLREYFNEGHIARNTYVKCDQKNKIWADWKWQGRQPVSSLPVVSGAWAKPDDAGLMIVLSNISEQEQKIEMAVPQNYQMMRVMLPDGPSDWKDCSSGKSFPILLKPSSVLSYEFKKESLK